MLMTKSETRPMVGSFAGRESNFLNAQQNAPEAQFGVSDYTLEPSISNTTATTQPERRLRSIPRRDWRELRSIGIQMEYDELSGIVTHLRVSQGTHIMDVYDTLVRWFASPDAVSIARRIQEFLNRHENIQYVLQDMSYQPIMLQVARDE